MRSCEESNKFFKAIFNNSKIADLFKLGKTKCRYFRKFVIAPFLFVYLMRVWIEFPEMNKCILMFTIGTMRFGWNKLPRQIPFWKASGEGRNEIIYWILEAVGVPNKGNKMGHCKGFEVNVENILWESRPNGNIYMNQRKWQIFYEVFAILQSLIYFGSGQFHKKLWQKKECETRHFWSYYLHQEKKSRILGSNA